MKHIISLAMLLVTISVQAQQFQWQASFGGIYSETAMAVIETSDGGCLLAGMTPSYKTKPETGQSGYVIKTDAQGNKLWKKYYDSNIYTFFYAVHERFDGYVLFGRTSTIPTAFPPHDLYIATIDRDGNLLSEKTIVESTNDYVGSVLPTDDGGFMLLGYGDGAVRLYKLASDFSIAWQKTYSGRTAWSLVKTKDGGFIFTGGTAATTATREDVFVTRTDAEGRVRWTKVIGTNRFDEGLGVKEFPEGFVAAGFSGQTEGGAFQSAVKKLAER